MNLKEHNLDFLLLFQQFALFRYNVHYYAGVFSEMLVRKPKAWLSELHTETTEQLHTTTLQMSADHGRLNWKYCSVFRWLLMSLRLTLTLELLARPRI